MRVRWSRTVWRCVQASLSSVRLPVSMVHSGTAGCYAAGARPLLRFSPVAKLFLAWWEKDRRTPENFPFVSSIVLKLEFLQQEVNPSLLLGGKPLYIFSHLWRQDWRDDHPWLFFSPVMTQMTSGNFVGGVSQSVCLELCLYKQPLHRHRFQTLRFRFVP